MHILERVRPGTRFAGPENIELPAGYTIEPIVENLNYPSAVSWDADQNMLIAESGFTSGRWAQTEVRILRRDPGGALSTVAAGFEPPINDITVAGGLLYVSHRGRISLVEDGRIRDLITGLPSGGLHQNNALVFGPDGRLYFGQGTVSNAGVVDSAALAQLHRTHQLAAHDLPGATVVLAGRNLPSRDPETGQTRMTGAFMPWGSPSQPGQRIAGVRPGQAASGSIMSARPDGSDLRVFAWGFRNPFGLVFGPGSRLFVTQQGAQPLDPRPIFGDVDTLWVVDEGGWYGWPDFYGGTPVTDLDNTPLEFLLTNHAELLGNRKAPPRPVMDLGQVGVGKLDFCLHPEFGFAHQAFVAEFGPLLPPSASPEPCLPLGHRIVRIDLEQGSISDFCINRSRMPASMRGNSGGLERPIEAKFGPDGNLYIVDFGIVEYRQELGDWLATAETGIVWRVARTGF